MCYGICFVQVLLKVRNAQHTLTILTILVYTLRHFNDFTARVACARVCVCVCVRALFARNFDVKL